MRIAPLFVKKSVNGVGFNDSIGNSVGLNHRLQYDQFNGAIVLCLEINKPSNAKVAVYHLDEN